jgi:hypothetical protein
MLSSILQGPPYLIQVEFDRTSNGFVVILPIASQDDTPLSITSLVCKLEPVDISDELHWRFWFVIDVDYPAGGNEPFQTQDRLRAKDYIPDDVQEVFLEVVRQAALKLADYVKPHFIYGVTKETQPTERDLRKYHMLISSLQESHGYVVHREGTNDDSRVFWVLRRIAG